MTKDVEEYLAALSPERRPHVEALRALVRKAVPSATEGFYWNILGFSINGRPFVGIAARKNYLSLYLMDVYNEPRLRKKHEKALSKLKMGKTCVNFQSVDELPLDTIAAILAEAPHVIVRSGTMARVPAQSEPGKAAKTRRRAP